MRFSGVDPSQLIADAIYCDGCVRSKCRNEFPNDGTAGATSSETIGAAYTHRASCAAHCASAVEPEPLSSASVKPLKLDRTRMPVREEENCVRRRDLRDWRSITITTSLRKPSRAGRMLVGLAHLAQRLRLDLADAFASDLELPAYFFERAAVAVHQAEALLEDLPLAFGQRVEDVL